MDVNLTPHNVTPGERRATAEGDDDNTEAPGGSDGEGRTGGDSEDDAASKEEADASLQGRRTIDAWLAGRKAKPARKPVYAKAAEAGKSPATRSKRGKNTTKCGWSSRSKTRTGRATG